MFQGKVKQPIKVKDVQGKIKYIDSIDRLCTI